MALRALPVILARVSYAAVAMVHILCGYTIVQVGTAYKLDFDHMRVREAAWLPLWTYDAVQYSNSCAPVLVGFVVGLGAFGLLLYLENGNEEQKAWIPACVTTALLIGFLPLIGLFWAFSLPF